MPCNAMQRGKSRHVTLHAPSRSNGRQEYRSSPPALNPKPTQLLVLIWQVQLIELLLLRVRVVDAGSDVSTIRVERSYDAEL